MSRSQESREDMKAFLETPGSYSCQWRFASSWSPRPVGAVSYSASPEVYPSVLLFPARKGQSD